MQHLIYVSEPESINITEARDILHDTPYSLILGNTEFSGESLDCESILIRSATTVDASIKQRLPKLRNVIRVGVGLDNVDLDFCQKENIAVYNSPGANSNAVAEYVICMMFQALRKLNTLTAKDIRDWNRFKFIGRELSQQTVGIVGFGHIGRLLHQKLKGLGVTKLLVYDPYVAQPEEPSVEMVTLEHLLGNSDITSLHLPLLDSTTHIINEDTIKMFKHEAILINAARGGIVDEQALLNSLTDKQLVYIADTVEGEPIVNEALIEHSNVIVTPHIASLTDFSDTNMVCVALNNFLKGNHLKNSHVSSNVPA